MGKYFKIYAEKIRLKNRYLQGYQFESDIKPYVNWWKKSTLTTIKISFKGEL